MDDDGPGLDPSLRETVLQRGVRADEAAPGSGLGLAIVADLVELYGGSIALGSSPLGGLRATLTLPVRLELQAGRIVDPQRESPAEALIVGHGENDLVVTFTKRQEGRFPPRVDEAVQLPACGVSQPLMPA